MENVSFIENENSLVILLDKKEFNKKTIEQLKRFFLLQEDDYSHIPFVSDKEQKEIEKILKDPNCNKFDEKNLIDI